MRKAELYRYVLDYFEKTMPEASSELHYSNPYELLVATVLSAQCTDRRVNMVTPALFEAYPTPSAMAEAGEEAIYEKISSISYPHNKARHIAALSRMLADEMESQVPSDPETMQRLPGVGRKTANVVAAVAFDQPAMPVDTHVFRVAERIGLTHGSKSPLQTERELTANIPRHQLSRAHHWLLLHGRYTCLARKPHCEACGLGEVCRHHKTERRSQC